MNHIALPGFYRAEMLLLAIPLAPAMLYACMYLILRALRKLRVNTEGWHAGNVHMGKNVVLPAMWLFALFQPLLRLESALMRRLSRRRDSVQEQTVSEVVVELIPFA